jgi:signal transduction histidine kinase
MTSQPVSDSSRFYRRLSGALLGGYLLVTILICGAAAWYILETRNERIDAAIENDITLSRALDEHVQRAFNAIDVVISDVASDLAAAGGTARVGEKQLHEVLKAKLALLPQTRSLFVYGPNLFIYAGSGFYPVPRIDGSKQEYVNTHVDNLTTSLHMGKPVVSQVTKLWTIPVTRRITGTDGKFLGVVGAIIDQHHFNNFYRDLNLSPGQGLALIRTDGILLFRFPQTPAFEPGTDMSRTSPIFQQPTPLPEVTTLHFTSKLDNTDRVVTYRDNSELGLILAISHEVDTLLAPWRREMRAIIAGVAVAVAGLTILLWIAIRQIRRRAVDERQHSETLEKRVQERTAELEAANEELEAFSYSVSHDLRSPLNIIGGYMYLVRNEHAQALPPAALEMLKEGEDAVRQMSKLIEDLLGLSRISRQSIDKRTVDLSALAHEITRELALAHPGQTPGIDITPELSARADAGLARVVLQNLLANAWKYSAKAAQPRIAFGVQAVDGERAFFVRDNGAGFDMRQAQNLFRPFQRLHSSQEFEGSGVGLATVARIVQRHGGRIWAESSPGQGATFYFTLPDD